MPRAAHPADVRVRPDPGPSDIALLRSNTPASVSRLTDRYWSRSLALARAILASDDAATRAVSHAAAGLLPAGPGRPGASATVGPRLMGAVARCAVGAREAEAGGVLDALSDRECTAVAMAFYGRMSVAAVARELRLPDGVVASQIEAGVRRLAETTRAGGERSA